MCRYTGIYQVSEKSSDKAEEINKNCYHTVPRSIGLVSDSTDPVPCADMGTLFDKYCPCYTY